jgi:hypothetical protein
MHTSRNSVSRKFVSPKFASMKASSLSLPAAIVMAVGGMIWGIVMAISQNHAAMPAHAHLNLLGFVSLFLFGLFYHLHPAIDRSRLALVQVWAWIVATIVLTIGVGLIHSGYPSGDPLAAVGSLVALADMMMFGWIVVRRDQVETSLAPSVMPAE